MVSIIVPVYKSKATLERCVESLLAQTVSDVEILLVDDGSPDGSGALCDELRERDARIRVLHQANGGVSSARNAGIEAAKSEYLVFADSDDYVEPDFLERMLEAIREDDIAVCGFHHHYLGQDVVRIPEVPGNDGVENFLALYGQGFWNMPWNKLYKRDFVGRFDETLSLGEDLLFNLDYLHRADGVAIVRAALCHYIQDDTGCSLSSQKREDKLELAKRIWREVSRFYEELSGHQDESGVINARLIQEVLDDVESLPFDGEHTKKEKLERITRYCQDAELGQAGANAALKALDYKVIHLCMRQGWPKLAYDLSELRAVLVRAKLARQKETDKEPDRLPEEVKNEQ